MGNMIAHPSGSRGKYDTLCTFFKLFCSGVRACEVCSSEMLIISASQRFSPLILVSAIMLV